MSHSKSTKSSNRAAAELDALLDAAVDAIVMIDENGGIVEFNRAAERLFGYGSEEILGQTIGALMPEPYRSGHPTYMQRYLESGEAHIIGRGREAQARKSDGRIFPVWISVGEAVYDSRRHYVGIIRDLTEQRAAEREQRSLEGRLAHVGRFSLMGEMAAGIAHEINQPLSAIATYSQAAKRLLAEKLPEDDDLIRAVEQISEQVHRAGEVIDNLRKFIGNQDIVKTSLDLNETLLDAMGLVEADTNAEQVEVKTEFAAGLPTIEGNAVQLQQVFLNLTRNAVDAMKTSIRSDKSITVATGSADGHVWFSVSDRGPGVSRQLADGIFHPFVTTKQEGLGVGLAISRTIVQAHNGEVVYKDNPQGGAVFTVFLPAEGRKKD